VEPVCRRRLSGSKALQAQIELDLNGLTSKQSQDASAGTPVIPEGMSRTDDPPVIEADVKPVDEVHIQEAEVVEVKPRKSRRQASEVVEQTVASEPMSEPALAPNTEVVDSSPGVAPRKVGHHRLTKRQAADGRLPRHERWKRRLHPACW
jgi:hypothetical protein